MEKTLQILSKPSEKKEQFLSNDQGKNTTTNFVKGSQNKNANFIKKVQKKHTT